MGAGNGEYGMASVMIVVVWGTSERIEGTFRCGVQGGAVKRE